MSDAKIRALEQRMYELSAELHQLRKAAEPTEVPDYPLQTLDGPSTLGAQFAGRDKLLVIHNMGQGCRYCTLWADGINAFLPHLETVMSVLLVSRDEPALQRRLANERGWRFRMASHRGGDYIREQNVDPRYDNAPGVACYRRDGDRILRMASSSFGPGDAFCALWPLLSLAGLGTDDWTPQFNYWRRPDTLDDGGANLVD